MRDNAKKPLSQRFWAKVVKTDGCWSWQGSLNNKGYGRTSVKIEGEHIGKLAHHVAMFLTTGTWPKYLMHTCDNPVCVRPEHLREASHRENLVDASLKGRLAGKHVLEICKKGELYT